MYDLAQYFMAGFGAGITLLLTALGYLIGRTSEGIRRERVAKHSRRSAEAYGTSLRSAKDQAEATIVSLGRVRTAIGDFSPNLQKEFAHATGITTDAENVAASVAQMAPRVLGQASTHTPLESGDDSPSPPPVLRTRTEVVADLLIFAVVFAATVVGAWISVEYLAAYAMGLNLDTGIILVTSRALIFGIGVTALGFAVGFVLRECIGGARFGTATPALLPRTGANRVVAIAATLVGLAIAGTLIAAAIASRVAGTAWALSGAFGLLHAVFLVGFGAPIDISLVSAAHLLYLATLGTVIVVAALAAVVLLGVDAVLAVTLWLVRLLAIFGKMLMPWRRARAPEFRTKQEPPVSLPASAAIPAFGAPANREPKVPASE
jgi:hypothetical protein